MHRRLLVRPLPGSSNGRYMSSTTSATSGASNFVHGSPFKKTLVATFSLFSGLYLGGTAYFHYTQGEDAVIHRMCRVFEAGGKPGWEREWKRDSNDTIQARDTLHDTLVDLFRPTSIDKYAVVVGATGTGKSTAVRRAVRAVGGKSASEEAGEGGKGTEREEAVKGGGAVYFSAPTLLPAFASKLLQALDYSEPFSISGPLLRFISNESKEQALPALKDEPAASWGVLVTALRKASLLYLKRNKRPPVLVLDAMDLVSKKDPAFFSLVQDFAKECADGGTLRIVLVFSDGKSLPLLMESTAESRSMLPFEVDDLSDEAAIAYLVSRRVEKGRAKALVDRVSGGRFVLLQRCVGSEDTTVDSMVLMLEDDAKRRLNAASVSPTCPLLQRLVVQGRVAAGEATGLMAGEKIATLLEKNILTAHPGLTGGYTFHSRTVASFCAGEIRRAKWGWL